MIRPPVGSSERMDSRTLFPTKLYSIEADDAAWRGAVLDDILAWQAAHPETLERSSRGGAWHSPTDAFTRPAFAPLVELVVQSATDIFIRERYVGGSSARLDSMWANVNPAGAYHVPHTHGEAAWAGVYYVRTPARSPGLVLMDPRGGIGNNRPVHVYGTESDRFTLDVSAGMLVFFPAWLMHYVEPHAGDEPRVSVSFNIRQIVRPRAEVRPPRTADTPHFVHVPKVLTPAQCRRIIEHADGKWGAAAVGDGQVNPDIRDSDVAWLDATAPDSDWHWLHRRVLAHGSRVNDEHFGLDIGGGMQAHQITRYRPGQFYEQHVDVGNNAPTRTLSCAITLRRAGRGGGTHFPDSPEQPPRQLVGDALFFRADEPHSALPVERGERFSLITWFRRR